MSVYMVFPYMDHDLAGLLENERVKLQPSQIKLYMKQLLEGTEYMHRVRISRVQLRREFHHDRRGRFATPIALHQRPFHQVARPSGE